MSFSCSSPSIVPVPQLIPMPHLSLSPTDASRTAADFISSPSINSAELEQTSANPMITCTPSGSQLAGAVTLGPDPYSRHIPGPYSGHGSESYSGNPIQLGSDNVMYNGAPVDMSSGDIQAMSQAGNFNQFTVPSADLPIPPGAAGCMSLPAGSGLMMSPPVQFEPLPPEGLMAPGPLPPPYAPPAFGPHNVMQEALFAP
eukprot:148752_1